MFFFLFNLIGKWNALLKGTPYWRIEVKKTKEKQTIVAVVIKRTHLQLQIRFNQKHQLYKPFVKTKWQLNFHKDTKDITHILTNR